MGMKVPEVLRSKEMGVGRHNLHFCIIEEPLEKIDFNNLRSRSNMAKYMCLTSLWYFCVVVK